MSKARWTAALFAAALIVLVGFAQPAHAFATKRMFLYTGAATDSTNDGMADSTDWKGTSGCQRMFLYLKPNRFCRVAIAVYSGDTTGAALDTTNTAVFDFGGYNTTVAADSTTKDELLYPKADQAASYELTAGFPAAGVSKWGSPRGRLIPLRASDGTWYTGMTTRIRLRVISATGGVVLWTAKLIGYEW